MPKTIKIVLAILLVLLMLFVCITASFEAPLSFERFRSCDPADFDSEQAMVLSIVENFRTDYLYFGSRDGYHCFSATEMPAWTQALWGMDPPWMYLLAKAGEDGVHLTWFIGEDLACANAAVWKVDPNQTAWSGDFFQ